MQMLCRYVLVILCISKRDRLGKEKDKLYRLLHVL